MNRFISGLKSRKTSIISGIIAVLQFLKFTGLGDQWFGDVDVSEAQDHLNSSFDSIADALSWIFAAIAFFFARDADKTDEDSEAITKSSIPGGGYKKPKG